MLAPVVPLLGRLRLAMIVAAVVMGSVLGLLLAHSDEVYHAVPSSSATAPGHGPEAASTAAWWLGETLTTVDDARDSAPVGDLLAFCMTLATCFAVLLLALFGVRHLPGTRRLLSLSVVDPPARSIVRIVPAPGRPLLSVYRI